MPTLTITKNYDDGSALTEAMLDSMKSSIETFVNTTKLDADNIQDASISPDHLDADAQARFVPVGVVLPYAGSSAPSGFLLCYGQAVSQSTYADLFAIIGTTYDEMWGASAPSAGTFRIPDYRGAGLFGKDNMGGSAANRITDAAVSIDGTVLGDTGGAQTVTLVEANLAAHTHGITDGGHTHNTVKIGAAALSTLSGSETVGASGTQLVNDNDYVLQGISGTADAGPTSSSTTGISATNSTGSGTAVNKMPPTAICNFIIKT